MPELETVWNRRHQSASPWESGKPCAELQRVLQERPVAPGRALEIGCGNGVNAAFLASRGFAVTACDISGDVLERARASARSADVSVRFFHSDVLKLPDLGAPFAFVFDRGYYQHGRVERAAFEKVLERVTGPGSLYLAIMPNANDRGVNAPRAVREEELRTDFARLFELMQLRECRFDPVILRGREVRPLMWSALFRRK
jgi:SAM-dependent methyltransferase